MLPSLCMCVCMYMNERKKVEQVMFHYLMIEEKIERVKRNHNDLCFFFDAASCFDASVVDANLAEMM